MSLTEAIRILDRRRAYIETKIAEEDAQHQNNFARAELCALHLAIKALREQKERIGLADVYRSSE